MILDRKVQKRELFKSPRGFRGRPLHFTCEKVTSIAALSLKYADSAAPENTRHFCKNRPLEIQGQA